MHIIYFLVAATATKVSEGSPGGKSRDMWRFSSKHIVCRSLPTKILVLQHFRDGCMHTFVHTGMKVISVDERRNNQEHNKIVNFTVPVFFHCVAHPAR